MTFAVGIRSKLQLRTRFLRVFRWLTGAPEVTSVPSEETSPVVAPIWRPKMPSQSPPPQVDLSTWMPRTQDPNINKQNDPQRAVSLKAYLSAEHDALKTISIPSLMAFKPATFDGVGYPTSVQSDAELVRYADHNFEAEVRNLYAPGASFPPVGYVNAFTEKESELAQGIRDVVADFTGQRFGRRVRPMTNLMVQFGPFRCVEALSTAYGRKLSVFEPGPGAGYLGALLAQSGYSYGSMDVTQSLYLWQSHLLDVVTKGAFNELALPENQESVDRASVLHMPWWIFSHQMEATPLRYDMVYSNSNLGEMSHVALAHLLKFAHVVLQDSDVAAFTFFSTGMTKFSTLERIDAELLAHGFVSVPGTPFHCYQLAGRDPDRIILAFEDGIPHIGGDSDKPKLDAKTVFASPRSEAPIDTEFAQWFYDWDTPIIDD